MLRHALPTLAFATMLMASAAGAGPAADTGEPARLQGPITDSSVQATLGEPATRGPLEVTSAGGSVDAARRLAGYIRAHREAGPSPRPAPGRAGP